MKKLLDEFIHEIKSLNKIRSLSLLGLLILFITASVLTGQLQKDKNFKQQTYAAAADQGTPAFMMYGTGYADDTFAPGWTAKSWHGGEINPAATTVYDGTHALSFQPKAAKDTVEISTTNPIDISKYKYLNFFAHGGIDDLDYQVTLLGAADANGNHKPIGKYISVDQFGVPPTAQWFVYGFSLSDFNAGTTQVYGFALTDVGDNGDQGALYLDEMAFSAARATETTPTPKLGSPGNQNALSPTRVPDYYPDISPWVFIIPAVIIFLAIFFE